MIRIQLFIVIILCASFTASKSYGTSESGFESIFDGRTLSGWTAAPETSANDWSVEKGVILGNSTQKQQVFLVYDDHDLRDFELKFSYRLNGKGNTGVDIRIRQDHTGKRLFEAYHADIGHPGIGSHILGAWDFHFATRKEYPCRRGTKLVIFPNGETKHTTIPNALTKEDVKMDQWNHVHVIAIGNSFSFYINSKLSSEFTDNFSNYFAEGSIGLQIHDPGVKVKFKDILLKRI